MGMAGQEHSGTGAVPDGRRAEPARDDRDADARVTEAQLGIAVTTLRAGGVIGLPTETVYGLAANAADEQAVASIYRIKGRPADHPLIVHVADAQAARQWAQWTPLAQRLADAFWPGPLTLVLKRHPDASPFASAGQDTIALRVSSHPVFQRLMQALAPVGITGLAAPSANRFGRISPSRAAHVRSGLGGAVPLVLDGGPARVGVESTIVDLSRGEPVLLRPGGIGLQALADCLGQSVRAADSLARAEPDAPRVPGALPSHYAPSVPLRLLSADALAQVLRKRAAALAPTPVPQPEDRAVEGAGACRAGSGRTASDASGTAAVPAPAEAPMQVEALAQAEVTTQAEVPAQAEAGVRVEVPIRVEGLPMGRIAVWSPTPPPEQPGLFWRRQPTDAPQAARHLYDTLHQLDALGVDAILVLRPPADPAWRAVQDRLQRAAAAG